MHIDILILAAIAIFIVLRLRGVLGEKTGHFPTQDTPRPDEKVIRAENSQQDRDALAQTKELAALLEGKIEPDLSLAPVATHDTLKEICAIDRHFNLKDFNDGARIAFEMIVHAYGKHDRTALKPLLSKEIYDSFATEIDAQQKQGQRHETTILAITTADIESVELHKNTARIGVHFISEQNLLTRDKDGQIIEGDTSAIEIVEDHWSFERDLRHPNPNWTLVATS